MRLLNRDVHHQRELLHRQNHSLFDFLKQSLKKDEIERKELFCVVGEIIILNVEHSMPNSYLQLDLQHLDLLM